MDAEAARPDCVSRRSQLTTFSPSGFIKVEWLLPQAADTQNQFDRTELIIVGGRGCMPLEPPQKDTLKVKIPFASIEAKPILNSVNPVFLQDILVC